MSFKKVYDVAEKFAGKTVISDRNEKFRQQRENLEEFFFQMDRKIASTISEMGGDLFTLKEKGFPQNEWKQLAKIYQALIALRKSLDPARPYESAKKIIDTINERTFKAHINTLDVIIHHFLQNNQVELGSNLSGMLGQSTAKSISQLNALVKHLQSYMDAHPLIDDPQTISTLPPPRPRVIEDPGLKSSGPSDVTNPAIKVKP
jgi:hypothetical protein